METMKRGPGRPPGPCKTPYKKKVPRVVGVGEDRSASEAGLTRVDAAAMARGLALLDAGVGNLSRAANLGDPAARLTLRERYGVVLPLVEARVRGLPLCAVLSGQVDLTCLSMAASGWAPPPTEG